MIRPAALLAALLLAGAAFAQRALPPRVYTAVQGAAALDTPQALAAYTRAHLYAYGSPDIHDNLAELNLRAGRSAAAALWLRASLEADPGAPDAAEKRRRIRALAGQVEASARAALAEAEKLAAALPDTPPRPGAASPRRQAYDALIQRAYQSFERAEADAMSERARARLPGEKESALVEERRKYGQLWSRAWVLDEKAALALRTGLGSSPDGYADDIMAHMYGELGRPGEAARWLRRLSGRDLRSRAYGFYTLHRLWLFGHPDAPGLYARAFQDAGRFEEGVFNVAGLIMTYMWWSGDRAGAVELATAMLAHHDRFKPDLSINMAAFSRWAAALTLGGRTGEAVAAFERTPGDAIIHDEWDGIFLPLLYERDNNTARRLHNAFIDRKSKSLPGTPRETLHKVFPVSQVAFTLSVTADSSFALEQAAWWRDRQHDDSFERWDQPKAIWALRVAVGQNRADAAVALAEAGVDSPSAAVWLRVLERKLRAAGYPPETGARVRQALRRVHGGHEPPDTAGDLRLRWLVEGALLAQRSEWGQDVPAALARLGTAPEQVPADLAYYAHMRINAARLALLP